MAKRPKLTRAEKGKPTKKLNAIRRWHAYMLSEVALDPRNKPANLRASRPNQEEPAS